MIGVCWLWGIGMSVIKIDPRQIISCGMFYSILIGSTILSDLYLASMSIDRSFIILYPTRYRLLVTRRHILIRIFSILFVIILFMIPHHYYYYYNPKTTIFICEFYPFINHWKIHLWTFLHAIVFVSIPSIITCISSIILLHNRCQHRRISKNQLSINARRIERNSILIVFISIAVLFSLLPSVILEIFIVHDRLSNHEILCSIRWKIYKILLNWFLTFSLLNYSLKFYIRLIISPSYRIEFLHMINCNILRTNNNNEQHLLPLRNQNRTKSIDF